MSFHAFQQRVIDEKTDLDTKITNLEKFLTTTTFQGLDPAEQARLTRQAVVMTDLSKILGERIENF